MLEAYVNPELDHLRVLRFLFVLLVYGEARSLGTMSYYGLYTQLSCVVTGLYSLPRTLGRLREYDGGQAYINPNLGHLWDTSSLVTL